MNFSIVKHIIGYVLVFEAALMALPTIVAVICREGEGWSFVITAALCLLIGFLLLRKSRRTEFLCKGRICNCCPELDHYEYNGESSVSHHRYSYEPG